jgi:nicotinate-nucleotide adenylyltransferase
MKLCVFQGTFNPIHNAHLNMAQYVIDNFGFDKILFIPAAKPPHKTYDENFSIHRLNMVKIAVEGNEHFDVSDIEYKRNSKSYTYLTIQELYKKI